MTSFNQLTLGAGQVALLTNFSPFWPVVAIDEIPPRHDLVLIADTAIPTAVIQLARSLRKGILLVDLRRGLVWDEGRPANWSTRRRGASRYRHAVFATEKVLVRFSGDIDRGREMAGLTRLPANESLEAVDDVQVVVAMSDERDAAWPALEIVLATDFEEDPLGWLDHAARGRPFVIGRGGGRSFAVMTAVTVHPAGLAGFE